MSIYIAKPNSWFKEGTMAELIEFLYTNENGERCGLFRGTYVVEKNEGYDKYWHDRGFGEGDEVQMNEVCAYSEFEERNPQYGDDDI